MNKNALKITTLLLALAMILSLAAGCAKSDEKDQEGNAIENGNNANEEDQKDDSIENDDVENQKDSEDANKEGQAEGAITITDSLGRLIEIQDLPEKIVSLAPNATEILFALGLDDRITGVSQYCDYPEEAESKEKLGDYWQPNVELIVEAEPDILFVGRGAGEDFINTMEENGVTAVALEGSNLEETYETIINAGKLTGTQEKAQEIVDSMRQKAEEIQNKVESADKLEAYFVVSYGDQGNYTAGPGSFIDEMIKLAGGENVAGDLDQAWAEYNIEKLVEKQPDIVFSTLQAQPEGIKDAPGYKELDAIKEGKLVILDDNLINRAGPRLVEGLEDMAKGMHPDLFK